jgi:hypothetical protein
MAEHTKGQDPKNRVDQTTGRTVREDRVNQNISSGREGSSSLDEKSSGVGRNNKNSGLATKDGLTGSDYDGQVTE